MDSDYEKLHGPSLSLCTTGWWIRIFSQQVSAWHKIGENYCDSKGSPQVAERILEKPPEVLKRQIWNIVSRMQYFQETVHTGNHAEEKGFALCFLNINGVFLLLLFFLTMWFLSLKRKKMDGTWFFWWLFHQ